MGKARKCPQRTSDGVRKTCHATYGEAKAARERVRLEGRDVEIYPHEGHFHLRSKPARLYVVSSPVRSPRKPQKPSAHRGGTKRGSVASGRLSGGSTEVSPGEGRQAGSDSLIPGRCQEGKSKRDKSLYLLTVIKIMCYNSRFFRNGHIRHIPYVRNIKIYDDISPYSRQNGHNGQKVQMGFTGQNGQNGFIRYFRPYATLYHQSPYVPTRRTCPASDLPIPKSVVQTSCRASL